MGRTLAAKERQRRHNCESYHATNAGLQQSRALVETLSQQHSAAIARHELQKDQQPNGHVLDQYVAASRLVQELFEQKKSLRLLLDAREKLQNHITVSIDQEVAEANARCRRIETQLSAARDSAVSFRPLSKDECYTLVNAYYEEIKRFLQTRSSHIPQSSELVDWKQVDGTIQKVVGGHTPLELSMRSWTIQISPIDASSFYSPAMNSTMQCLQEVDSNNVVLFERFYPNESSISYYSLFIASRFPIEDGFGEILLPLDRSRLISPMTDYNGNESERWVELRTWVMYQKHEEDQCRIITGCSIKCLRKEDTQLWMKEMRSGHLRWEDKVVAPLFMVPTEE